MKERVRSFLSSKDEKNRERSSKDNLFNPDYVSFDDFGHVEVRCMKCGTPIMTRTEIPTKDPGVRTIAMKKLASYRQIDRQGKPTILACQQCEPGLNAPTEEEEDRLETVIATGWTTGMVWAGKSDETIKEFLRRARK